jgi:hypothetical protein
MQVFFKFKLLPVYFIIRRIEFLLHCTRSADFLETQVRSMG